MFPDNSPSGRSPSGETHHVLIIVPLLRGDPSVRVAVPDSELHGAAKGACDCRESRKPVSVGSTSTKGQQ